MCDMVDTRWRELSPFARTRKDLGRYLSPAALAACQPQDTLVVWPGLTLDWPASVHYDADGGKALLRALARRHLPEAVWNRPKHGFSVPLQHYFNGQWNAACEHYIARCKELAPFLNAAAVHQLWQAAKQGKASRRLAYTFVVLLIWLAGHPLSNN